MSKRKFILCISDLHVPVIHPDTLPLLRAMAKKYGKPTRGGKQVETHRISPSEAEAGIINISEELRKKGLGE